MTLLLAAFACLIFAERLLKHLLVVRFFRRPAPTQRRPAALVSILQPILSGDPTLEAGLEQNLLAAHGCQVEFLWLVDEDDSEGQRICRELAGRYPQKATSLVLLPAPGARQNPKMVKLIAGARLARGDVLCVLDDDTRLPDGGLQTCLAYLDLPRAGLAFGLPYYVSFGNLWSSLVAYFVNSHSLMNYVPYAMLGEPVTINGMFYAMRREVLAQLGGFDGLEGILADDFAIAQRVRAHGLRLVQTPVRHAISTWVASGASYTDLIRRWFIFPRESMLRHLRGREQLMFNAMILLPVFFPWLACTIALFDPRWRPLPLLYFACDYLIFAFDNAAYLSQASPWRSSYWVLLIELLLPLQILAALFSPQRIVWRGHVMQAKAGGGIEIVRRR